MESWGWNDALKTHHHSSILSTGAINVDVVDKVNKAISTAKVFDALQRIQQALKVRSQFFLPQHK